jgi:hypothetical protein
MFIGTERKAGKMADKTRLRFWLMLRLILRLRFRLSLIKRL